MLYTELLALTDEKATYEQFTEIEAVYMSKEAMTKQQAARLWKRRFAEKSLKPRAKEMREIKQAIRDLQREKQWAERDEQDIHNRYAEKIAEYDAESWVDRNFIETLNYRKDRDIYQMWDAYGNDVTIHIIYEDGSQCIASGTEIVSGDIVPKMQHIAYACYADGWTEYDTLPRPRVHDEDGNVTEDYKDTAEFEGENEPFKTAMQTIIKASPFDRRMKLEAELNKVHGRIIRLLDSLKAYELDSRRLVLEERKYKLMKQKVTGEFNIDPETGEIDDENDPEKDDFDPENG